MNRLLNAVTINTDSYFDLVNGKQQNTTVTITADAVKHGFFKKLGPMGLIVYLTIMSHYHDSQGLPDEYEIAELTGLCHKTVEATIKDLLNLEIDGVPLFHKKGLVEKNKQNHVVYMPVR